MYLSVYNRSMKNDNSRETILNCALQLFSSKGYDAVGISEIVDMAGITKPTLYYFFGSKEGLFKELLKINYDTLSRALSVACQYQPNRESYFEDVYPALRTVVNAYFSFAADHSEFYLMSLALTFAPPTSAPAVMSEEYTKVQYVNFMGNEFGHPEWIDFPREGNGWSYFYARRRWDLADDKNLRYQYLQNFDMAMVAYVKENNLLSLTARLLVHDEKRKVLIYQKENFVFVFNFHPQESCTVMLPIEAQVE